MPGGSLASRRFPRCALCGCALAASLGFVAAASVDKDVAAGEWAWKAPLAPRSLLLDVAARNGRLVAVGERGHILVSRDGGGSWTQADVPTRALLTGVFMHDGQLGWAVGHDEVVVRTRDGGLTWERVYYSPEGEKPLLDVWFADARRGLAVGAYGELLATSDGGDTWEPRRVSGDDDFHLNHIVAAADGALYLAAEAGHLYRSLDGGESWEALASPYNGSFFGVLPLADGTLLAFGLRGHLYRSEDGGATWTRLETGTEATLMAGVELAGGRVVIAGLAGAVLRSADGGRSFRGEVLEDRRGRVAVVALEGSLLLLGEGGSRRLEVAP